MNWKIQLSTSKQMIKEHPHFFLLLTVHMMGPASSSCCWYTFSTGKNYHPELWAKVGHLSPNFLVVWIFSHSKWNETTTVSISCSLYQVMLKTFISKESSYSGDFVPVYISNNGVHSANKFKLILNRGKLILSIISHRAVQYKVYYICIQCRERKWT